MPLLRGIARTAVVAGTASAVSGRVQRRQQRKWSAQEAPAQGYGGGYEETAAPPVPEQRAAAPSTADTIEQLKSLAELKAQGVLTEAEFAVQKEKILHP
jgi:Short C-terminal domain